MVDVSQIDERVETEKQQTQKIRKRVSPQCGALVMSKNGY